MKEEGLMKAPIKQCPYCESEEGFFTRMYAYGSVKHHIGFNGEERENGDMYEGLQHKGGKRAYCSNCRKYLFNISDLDKERVAND